VDVREGVRGDPLGVRREIPPGTRKPPAQSFEAELAETGASGRPARRRSDRTLEGRTLAFPQKGAVEEGRTVVFVDESGFYLLPAVVRTYAPVGETPVLREHLSREHLSAISAITKEGKLYMH
jgi:hypothetical protein